MQELLGPYAWVIWAVLGLCVVGFILKPWFLRLLVPFIWQRFAKMGGLFGQSAWATPKHLRKAGLLKPGGLFLGAARGHDLFLHGDECILTIAPRGAGKSSALVIPNLINWRNGSVVVTDPSGELTAQTKRRRGEFSDVVVLNPFAHEMKNELGVDLGDTGFNPFAFLKPGPDLDSDARFIAALLLPQSEKSAENPMWINEARDLMTGMLMAMVNELPPNERNLSSLFTLLRAGPGLTALLDRMTKHPDPLIRAYGNQFFQMDGKASKQWIGILGAARGGVSIYAPGTALGNHVSKNAFDPADLKRKNMSVYIILPSGRIHSHKAWFTLLTSIIMETIGRTSAARSVVLVCDEFQNLGYVPTIQSAIAQYRKAGLRVWLIAHTMGRLTEIYSENGLNDLLGQSDVKQFFAVNDPDLARRISDWIGPKTMTRTVMGGAGEMVGVPLVRPDEIMRMREGEQIIIHRKGTLPPIKGKLVPFFKRPAWKTFVDPNPYMRKN